MLLKSDVVPIVKSKKRIPKSQVPSISLTFEVPSRFELLYTVLQTVT